MTQKRTTENDLVVSGSAAATRRSKAARPRSKHSATPAEAPVISAAAEPETAAPTSTVPSTSSAITTVAPTVTIVEPAHADIARLAYSYWEARGFQGGSPEEDWLRAEVEIRNVFTVTA